MEIKVGSVFTKLTVVRKITDTLYECKCRCGNIQIYHWKELVRGYVISCGCPAMFNSFIQWKELQ